MNSNSEDIIDRLFGATASDRRLFSLSLNSGYTYVCTCIIRTNEMYLLSLKQNMTSCLAKTLDYRLFLNSEQSHCLISVGDCLLHQSCSSMQFSKYKA